MPPPHGEPKLAQPPPPLPSPSPEPTRPAAPSPPQNTASVEWSASDCAGSVAMVVGGAGQNAAEASGAAPTVVDIVAPTLGEAAMYARNDTSCVVPWGLPPQPLAREEEAPAPFARSLTGEESEARACDCSLCGKGRTPIAFDPAGFSGRLSRRASCAAAGGGGPRV